MFTIELLDPVTGTGPEAKEWAIENCRSFVDCEFWDLSDFESSNCDELWVYTFAEEADSLMFALRWR